LSCAVAETDPAQENAGENAGP